MSIWQSLLLGIVQGVTEFLPISSSGHLVIVQQLLNVPEADVVFDVLLHVASLVSIVIFFWRRILTLRLKHYMLLAVGTIPAALAGVLFKDWLTGTYSTLGTVPLELIASGFINVYIHKKLQAASPKDAPAQKTPTETKADTNRFPNITIVQSLKIGVMQAFALVPAISRSGSTVAGGLWQGLNRDEAFSFAFLLAIPAILGASVLQLFDVIQAGGVSFSLGAGVVGFAATLLSGLASLALLAIVMKQARFMAFAWYCFGLGGLLLILQMQGVL